jgi:hypothetical protein
MLQDTLDWYQPSVSPPFLDLPERIIADLANTPPPLIEDMDLDDISASQTFEQSEDWQFYPPPRELQLRGSSSAAQVERFHDCPWSAFCLPREVKAPFHEGTAALGVHAVLQVTELLPPTPPRAALPLPPQHCGSMPAHNLHPSHP